jgi:two-component system nitrogen regulation sensor histidine kinase GlnL
MDTTQARWLGLVLLAVLFLATAIYGWRSAPRALINRRFAVQTLVLTGWATGVAGAHSSYAIDIWGRWAFTAACFMPATFLRFAAVFPTEAHTPPRFIRHAIYGSGVVLALAAAITPWIAHSYRIDDSGVLTRTSGPLMPVFVGYYVITAIVIFVVLSMKWRSAQGIPRAQLRLYCAGLLSFCLGGIASNMASPAIVGDSRFGALGPCFVMVFLAFLAHGIMRHRLMNIRLVVHNWLAVSIASLASIAPLLIIASHLEPFNSQAQRDLKRLALLLVAGLLAPPLWIATRRLIEQYIYRDYARFHTEISGASRRLSEVLSPIATAVVVSDTIFSALKPYGVAIYFRDGASGPRLVRIHHEGNASTFDAPRVFPAVLDPSLGTAAVLASPDYVPVETHTAENAALSCLAKHGWAAVFPLTSEGRLLAAVIVGPKRSNAPYYREDIRLLQVLTSQATIAFKNGELYERVLLANEYIHNIVATIQSGIFAVDRERNVRLLNDAAVSLLGLDDIAVESHVALSRLPESVVTVVEKILAGQVRSITADIVVARKGVDCPLMCCAAPLKRAEGEIVGVVASLSDLSILKELEMERARAERLNYFENLAAALAHEIANPIVPIKIMTQLLSTRYDEPNFITDFVRTVGREVSRIETLVQRLNSLSAPVSRRISEMDLRSLLTQVTELIQAAFDERAIQLDVVNVNQALTVAGDASELQELFLNLLTNALEATPRGGSVSVETTRESRDAIVYIRDTGPGIPDEMAGRIFEPFVSSKNRGSGLGLAICHGIVKRHRGDIVAVNTPTGAEFTVRLPLAEGDPQPAELKLGRATEPIT